MAWKGRVFDFARKITFYADPFAPNSISTVKFLEKHLSDLRFLNPHVVFVTRNIEDDKTTGPFLEISFNHTPDSIGSFPSLQERLKTIDFAASPSVASKVPAYVHGMQPPFTIQLNGKSVAEIEKEMAGVYNEWVLAHGDTGSTSKTGYFQTFVESAFESRIPTTEAIMAAQPDHLARFDEIVERIIAESKQ